MELVLLAELHAACPRTVCVWHGQTLSLRCRSELFMVHEQCLCGAETFLVQKRWSLWHIAIASVSQRDAFAVASALPAYSVPWAVLSSQHLFRVHACVCLRTSANTCCVHVCVCVQPSKSPKVGRQRQWRRQFNINTLAKPQFKY